MPRTGRIVLPNVAHHIVQRGHNRQVVFAADDDFRYYLDTLKTWKVAYGVREDSGDTREDSGDTILEGFWGHNT